MSKMSNSLASEQVEQFVTVNAAVNLSPKPIGVSLVPKPAILAQERLEHTLAAVCMFLLLE